MEPTAPLSEPVWGQMVRHEGRMWEFIQDQWVYSPLVPRKRAEFINCDIKRRRHQLWDRAAVYPSEKEIGALSETARNELKRRELLRRTKGVWYFNDGVPTYLTGHHYNFLVHYNLDVGPPDYREADRRYYWIAGYAEDMPWCYGLLHVGRRQGGKSYKAGNVVLNRTSLRKNHHAGAQSKNDEDVKALFKRAIVAPWQKMSAIVAPVHSGKSSSPEEKLEFFPPIVSGAKGALAPKVKALESWISTNHSKPGAYDGEKLGTFLNDEIFKDQTYDPLKRWNIVKRMFKQKQKVVAFSIHTSSVEEVGELGADRLRKFWKDSDPTNRNIVTGETKSGLVRYFEPCYDGDIIDRHGRSMVDACCRIHDANRQEFIDDDDQEGLMSYVRANPYTIAELLRSTGKKSLFNGAVLAGVLDTIEAQRRKPWQRYDLEWYDKYDRSRGVYAVENKANGRFQFSWLPKVEDQNRVEFIGYETTRYGRRMKFKPLNDRQFAVGCDPVDKRLSTGMKNPSKFSMHGKRKFNFFNELPSSRERGDYWPSNAYMVRYNHRLVVPSHMYDDAIKLIHFLGCEIHFENQKSNIEDHLINEGYWEFVAGRPASTHTAYTANKGKQVEEGGTPSSRHVINQYTEELQQFVSVELRDDWRRLPFTEDCNSLLDFDINKTTEYDDAVSLGFTELSANRFMPPPPEAIDVSVLDELEAMYDRY